MFLSNWLGITASIQHAQTRNCETKSLLIRQTDVLRDKMKHEHVTGSTGNSNMGFLGVFAEK